MTDRPDLDLLPTGDVVAHLLAAEERVLPVVRGQAERIAAAAELVAERLGRTPEPGRVVLVGAGTSGRLALAEAAELPGTFGLPRWQVRGLVAGGPQSTDGHEDDLDLAAHDLAALALTAHDAVVAVAASGRTPYTLAVAAAARAAGAGVVAVVTTPGTPLATLAAVAIELEVGPEVVRGSTRLPAGTAQKVALNALTTAAMVRLGRVHGDLMVDVEAANIKLQHRAAGIVAEIAGCSEAEATAALSASGGNARAAVVQLVLGLDPTDAAAHAARFITLRESLGQIP